MTFIELVVLLKDVAVGVAAISGTFIAKKGLDTWRRQLKGQSEYELSRRILVTLFKYNDAINGVRHPAIFSHEIAKPPKDDSEYSTPQEIDFYGSWKAYQARWEKVYTEKKLLYVDLLEAQAIWGGELNILFKKIFDLEHELALSVRHHLDLINPKTQEGYKKVVREYAKSHRDIMYDNLSNEPDEYKQDMASAIESVEMYLKPKLTHDENYCHVTALCKNFWVAVLKRLRINTGSNYPSPIQDHPPR